MTRYVDFFPSTDPIQSQEFASTPENRQWQLTAPLHDVIDAYFGRQPEAYQELIAELGGQILGQETGWKNISSIDQLYIAPAAAHDEMHYIVPALDLYTGFADDTPHAMVVSSNWPPDGGKADIAETNAKLNAFQAEHPDMAVAHFEVEYPKGTSMGRIGSHNIDVGLHLIRELGITPASENDILEIFHAIDIEYLSPNYPSAMQEAYRRAKADGSGVWLRGNCLHSLSEDNKYPRIDEFVSWWDFVENLKNGYELGMATGIRSYTAVNGLNEAKINGELLDIRNRVHEWFGKTWDPTRYAALDAVVHTSARRMYHNVQDRDAVGNVMWVTGEFTKEGAYRRVQSYVDITPERRDTLIADLIGGNSKVLLESLNRQAQRELGLSAEKATEYSVGVINHRLRGQGCKIQVLAKDGDLYIKPVESEA